MRNIIRLHTAFLFNYTQITVNIKHYLPLTLFQDFNQISTYILNIELYKERVLQLIDSIKNPPIIEQFYYFNCLL